MEETKNENSVSVVEQKNEEKLVKKKEWLDTQIMNQRWKLAQIYANSQCVPSKFQGKPNDCYVAIEIANEINKSLLFVMNALDIIKGKPSWTGQGCISLINSSKKFEDDLDFIFNGEIGSDDWCCVAYAKKKSTGKVCYSEPISIKMAKAEGWYQKDGSKWRTFPGQMMRYRSASFFARVYCPEVLLGLQTTEEIEDVEGRDFSRNKAKSDLTDLIKKQTEG